MELLLSQQISENPYRFAGTGIQVYSFEEALYHVYRYWKQSVDDVDGLNLAAWVQDSLGMSFVAAKMKEIAGIESFSERMLAFLTTIEYFDKDELAALLPDLQKWEKRLEWETYKERADDLMRMGEPAKAISLYRRALQFDENVQILNNLSIAYMQIEAHGEACKNLERAQELDKDNKNRELLLHYSEALIAANRTDEAAKAIELSAAVAPKSAAADILYLRGELALKMNQPAEAITYFEQAIALTPDEHFVFRLADVYAARRQVEKALDTLADHIPNREGNLPYLMKEAELYDKSGNMPAAISSIKKAIELRQASAELWQRLARYHRQNYDLTRAEEAVETALSIDAGNERAILESARIQKGIGRTKSYQQLLKGILTEFKSRYREVH